MSNNRPAAHAFPTQIALLSAIWLVGLLWCLSLDDPRLRYGSFLGGMAVANLGWLGLIRAVNHPRILGASDDIRAARTTRIFGALIVLGLGARFAAWWLPPAFSEDVFRYVYEGRVVWFYGWAFPFTHPPADAPSLGVAPELLDHAWLRINHPELSTIYPPLAQITFAVAGGLGELAGGGHLGFLKALLVGADLLTWLLVTLSLRAVGRSALESVGWGLNPLVVLEVAREGHADSLSALGLGLGLYGFVVARPRLGYLGFAAAAIAKLNGLIVLPAAARTTRRGLGLAIAVCTLVTLPYLFAGGTAGDGLSAYASKWRAGDGAFSVLLSGAELILGGDWARLPGWSSTGEITLTRHQLARWMVAGLFGGWALLVIVRPAPMSAVPGRAGMLLLGVLLLSPTLHPWYVLWLLPFVAAAPNFEGRRAAVALAVLAPALHHPGWIELTTGQWSDLGWVRGLVHLPVWVMLSADLAIPRRTR